MADKSSTGAIVGIVAIGGAGLFALWYFTKPKSELKVNFIEAAQRKDISAISAGGLRRAGKATMAPPVGVTARPPAYIAAGAPVSASGVPIGAGGSPAPAPPPPVNDDAGAYRA